ncbi:MAG: transketolase family protein [Planctomycetaceae bacterium]|jgi:transketolase|nr:transketolase family protein [Planctomycetaceae bacterium]
MTLQPLHKQEIRFVYGNVLNELITNHPEVLCLEADLSKASGTNPAVLSRYPDHFIDVGVAEANMIGLAAGLATEGKIPFCATFCCFATRRVYDQITISVAYANTNVKIIGTGPGVTQGPNGGTHMCFQDLAIMRVMPNMQVFSPCDAYEVRSVLYYMAENHGGMYMQLLRSELPAVFDETYQFQPGRARKLRDGHDVTLVSTGYMTHFAIAAAEELAKEGISVELLHCPSIKPFPETDLIESARKTNAVVTVENQSILGGLGGAVCETLSEHYPTRVKRLGIPDRFGEIATEEYLFEKHGFGIKQIKDACRDLLT